MSIAASFTERDGTKLPRAQGHLASICAARWSASFALRSEAAAPRSKRLATNMTGSVTLSARSADFQRAFVALRYFWGARGQALGEGLEQVGTQPAAADLVTALSRDERTERAQALGVELARLAAALEQRSLLR